MTTGQSRKVKKQTGQSVCREWMNKKSGVALTPNFDWLTTCCFDN